ncbi:PaaI family thioesterase [Roseicella aerolata]|uniref:PaaI family thioesterase n=1 Tax=Roseicella aerolata TaxID=2883479 RepID=A0A9X1IB45_9PROT|nr:PaaI family thioesterase [Roseicella aerolata]MCB4821147.1 PaaI family thioesterase [Roseicella aerolata]
MPDIPAGFVQMPGHDPGIYNSLIGPFWAKPEGEGLAIGFRVEARHCNPAGQCHGGMLAGFADIALAGGCNHVARLSRFLVTVSLTTDFLAPAALGTWVGARPEVLTVTRSTLFGQCLVTADGGPVLRASGTFRFGGDPDPRFDRLRRLLEANT